MAGHARRRAAHSSARVRAGGRASGARRLSIRALAQTAPIPATTTLSVCRTAARSPAIARPPLSDPSVRPIRIRASRIRARTGPSV
jgi:hypothetical protein